MFTLTTLESCIGGAGLVVMLATIALLLAGIVRGLGRKAGRPSVRPGTLRRSPWGYAIATVGFVVVSWLLWKPLPGSLSVTARALCLGVGALLLATGLTLVLWGRMALGDMYAVSSSAGAQLYADHRLVTSGPYALLRHPMYLGVMLTVLGGLLLYRTWTFIALVSLGVAVLQRARREEEALATEFGEVWGTYRDRTPGWWPRWRRLGESRRERRRGHG